MKIVIALFVLALAGCATPGETRQQTAMRVGCQASTFQPIGAAVLSTLFPAAAPGVVIETATVHAALAAYCAAHGGGKPVMQMTTGESS